MATLHLCVSVIGAFAFPIADSMASGALESAIAFIITGSGSSAMANDPIKINTAKKKHSGALSSRYAARDMTLVANRRHEHHDDPESSQSSRGINQLLRVVAK